MIAQIAARARAAASAADPATRRAVGRQVVDVLTCWPAPPRADV